MTQTRLQRVWTWLHDTFPERQIYIRSDGRVQFFTFSPSLQATLAGLTLIFLGWVAFATVNVIFKDRIIAATDHRYQQMQANYENRMAELQISYDDLNGALVAAEDRFKATADAFQAKQNAISGLLRKVQAARVQIRSTPAPSMAPAAEPDSVMAQDTTVIDADGGSSVLAMLPEPPAQARMPASKPAVESGFFARLLRQIGGLFATPAQAGSDPAAPQAAARHPALAALNAHTDRIARMGRDEMALIARAEQALRDGTGDLRAVMKVSGLNPDQLMRKMGSGGPEFPIAQAKLAGISDPHFTQAYLKADAALAEWDGLSSVMARVPLSMPVNGAQFDRSSGFGSRVDPFTGRYAFHPGVDFAGPWGAKVEATAPGTVVFAGYRGAYGNMVEIDHGLGIRTRYGHLSAVMVRPGMVVSKGMAVGRVGSTGRSTGPHMHYEVWYENIVRNPSRFIEAGRHVL